MGKVTDPSLLAALETDVPGKVSDPALLAQLEQQPEVPRAKVGTLTALGRGAAQGATLGLGERIQGLLQAALPVPGDAADFGTRYSRVLAGAQAENDKAKADHPVAYVGGNVIGGAAPTLLMPAVRGAQGAGLGVKMLAGAKAAAPVGAIVGGAESRDPTVLGKLGDAGLGAASAAAIGGTAPAVGAAAKKLLAPVADYFGGKALDLGRKAITGVSSPLARRKALDPEVVNFAFGNGAIRPFSSAEGVANRLREIADPLKTQYGQILADLEAKGVHGSEADKLAAYLAQEAQKANANSIVGTRADAIQSAADALASKPLPISGKGRLGLMQQELMKRELQTAAQNDFVREGRDSLAGAARKELAGTWRSEIEQAVQDQASKAPAEAAAFEPVKKNLHLALSALGPAEEAAARSARRSPFGLHEGMAVAAGLAEGNPGKALTNAGIMHLLKERTATTGASMSRAMARAMTPRDLPRAGLVGATGLTPEVEAMLRAIQLTPATADQDRTGR